MGNPLDSLGEEVNELVASFTSQPIVGDLNTLGFTQYSFWFAVAVALMLVALFVFKKKQSASLVPQGFFVNGMEYLVEFIRDDMCKGLLGESWKRHFPFIATVFLVVLANNIVGIIPGCKPGTGTISTTAARLRRQEEGRARLCQEPRARRRGLPAQRPRVADRGLLHDSAPHHPRRPTLL